MALGILVIMYIVLCIISIVGLLALFLTKNMAARKLICFAMAIWGILLAILNAQSLPSNWILLQAFAWGFGFVGLAAFVVRVIAKNNKQHTFAALLASASVIGGMLVFLLM